MKGEISLTKTTTHIVVEFVKGCGLSKRGNFLEKCDMLEEVKTVAQCKNVFHLIPVDETKLTDIMRKVAALTTEGPK